MSKSATEIKIGPWPGGINLLDKPDMITNEQCPWICNFDVVDAGLLTPRRALKFLQGHESSSHYLLGQITLEASATESPVMMGISTGAETAFYAIRSTNPADNTAFVNTAAGTYASVVQYQDKLWYIPSQPTSIGRSSPASYANTLTSVANMPYGDYGFVLKDRLFVVRKNTSELYFSKATDFTAWSAPDGGVIKVNPGDQKKITKVVVLNNQIVIFKRDETYILSFTNSPTGDGVLRLVSPDQGAFDAVTFNNEIYCYNSRSVFKFVNGFFQDIGSQLNFRETTGLSRFSADLGGKLHLVGSTLILGVGLYDPGVRAFAMNLDTGAWSIYEFANQFNNVLETASVTGRNFTQGQFTVFGNGRPRIYTMMVEKRTGGGQPDVGQSGASVPIKYEFFTKIYDFNDSMVWKRLSRWYMDIRFPTPAIYGKVLTQVNDFAQDVLEFKPDDATEINSAGFLVGNTKTFRFRTVQFGYSGTDSFTGAVTNAIAPTIRSIKAVVAVRGQTSEGQIANR